MSGIGKGKMMEYQQIIRDFVKRTQQNMLYIEEALEEGAEVFEVTHLVNSLLGLLVFPQQKYFDAIPRIPLSQLENEGWPCIKVVGDFEPASDLRELMRYLRNAIAHFIIEFVVDSAGQIVGLQVWNIKNQRKSWQAEISLTELRLLVNEFTDLILAEVKE